MQTQYDSFIMKKMKTDKDFTPAEMSYIKKRRKEGFDFEKKKPVDLSPKFPVSTRDSVANMIKENGYSAITVPASKRIQTSSSRVSQIIYADISGANMDEIMEITRLTRHQIDAVKKSPLYQQEHTRVSKKLEEKFINIRASKMAGDPVITLLRDKSITAAETIATVMENVENKPGTRVTAAKEILDRAGYKSQAGEVTPVIEIEEKVLERLERVGKDIHGEGTIITERSRKISQKMPT